MASVTGDVLIGKTYILKPFYYHNKTWFVKSKYLEKNSLSMTPAEFTASDAKNSSKAESCSLKIDRQSNAFYAKDSTITKKN